MDVKSCSKIIIGTEPKLKEINSLHFGTGTSIFPNGTQPFVFIFSQNIEDQMNNPTGSVCYLLETQYIYTNSTKIRKMGLLLKFGVGYYTVVKTWDESNSP